MCSLIQSLTSTTTEDPSHEQQRSRSSYKHVQSDPDLHYSPVDSTTTEDPLHEHELFTSRVYYFR